MIVVHNGCRGPPAPWFETFAAKQKVPDPVIPCKIRTSFNFQLLFLIEFLLSELKAKIYIDLSEEGRLSQAIIMTS